MAAYSVEIKRSAVRELAAVEPRAMRLRIVARIRSSVGAPRPPGSQKLAGEAERYRLRQGDWRILFEVDDAERRVTVVKIGHRREVYR